MACSVVQLEAELAAYVRGAMNRQTLIDLVSTRPTPPPPARTTAQLRSNQSFHLGLIQLSYYLGQLCEIGSLESRALRAFVVSRGFVNRGSSN